MNQSGKKDSCGPPSIGDRLESSTRAVSSAATSKRRRSRLSSRASSRSMAAADPAGPAANSAEPSAWQQEEPGAEEFIG